MFKKTLKPASFGAYFLYDENIDHIEKKAQNGDVEWDRLHGEIEAVKLEKLIFCHFHIVADWKNLELKEEKVENIVGLLNEFVMIIFGMLIELRLPNR